MILHDLHADTPSRLIAPYTGGRDEMVKKTIDTTCETPENTLMTTPDSRDQQAWHRLHLTARALVDRIQSGQLVRPEDYADLIAAVEDVDGVQFSDWWDREHGTPTPNTEETR
jgi:hypothetical protein